LQLEGEATPKASLFQSKGQAIFEANLFQPEVEAIQARSRVKVQP